ncbi:MAG: tRNA uridine-5-carboxymethylaminomethyl(34) synthesis GTPase MnmE [Alphaproteobacteria bacterium]|nr:tRNA uridine-5-carboxymethylaminomethyl(34) synthesis GTPase MnmE [Alphaproteobacteria bacterium]
MSVSQTGTIFAPATATGRAGVAVYRLSGPAAREAITRLCHPNQLPEPRQASLRTLVDPVTDDVIDHALVLWFPGPGSFTGEDVVEFQTHGGRAVADTLLRVLAALPGFALAEPGAFTRRAFENGRLDLTEAEAIADLVHAETEAQRKQALRQMRGALGALYQNWHDRLKTILAYCEASIDFADEELPDDLMQAQRGQLQTLSTDIQQHLADGHRGERIRDGLSIAILGAPNAGKSSLLNKLAAREAAIVSPIAGTTRDVVEVQLDLGGYAVSLADTAGLRETADVIENEGVRRALARAEKADIKILVYDAGQAADAATDALHDNDSLIVFNKVDTLNDAARNALRHNARACLISAETGEGLAEFTRLLIGLIAARYPTGGAAPLTRARHRQAIEEATEHLTRATGATEAALMAEDVRLAMRALGRVTGRVDVEDLLDIIFRDFCIGK